MSSYLLSGLYDCMSGHVWYHLIHDASDIMVVHVMSIFYGVMVYCPISSW